MQTRKNKKLFFGGGEDILNNLQSRNGKIKGRGGAEPYNLTAFLNSVKQSELNCTRSLADKTCTVPLPTLKTCGLKLNSDTYDDTSKIHRLQDLSYAEWNDLNSTTKTQIVDLINQFIYHDIFKNEAVQKNYSEFNKFKNSNLEFGKFLLNQHEVKRKNNEQTEKNKDTCKSLEENGLKLSPIEYALFVVTCKNWMEVSDQSIENVKEILNIHSKFDIKIRKFDVDKTSFKFTLNGVDEYMYSVIKVLKNDETKSILNANTDKKWIQDLLTNSTLTYINFLEKEAAKEAAEKEANMMMFKKHVVEPANETNSDGVSGTKERVEDGLPIVDETKEGNAVELLDKNTMKSPSSSVKIKQRFQQVADNPHVKKQIDQQRQKLTLKAKNSLTPGGLSQLRSQASGMSAIATQLAGRIRAAPNTVAQNRQLVAAFNYIQSTPSHMQIPLAMAFATALTAIFMRKRISRTFSRLKFSRKSKKNTK
jgi:hypothetical protein